MTAPLSIGPILVLLATTTVEKVAQYQAIARQRGLPLHFRRLNEIVDAFHSAPEEKGRRRDNARDKLAAVTDIARACQSPRTPQSQALRALCRDLGVSFALENIRIATDDSTFTMPRPIWRGLHRQLADQWVDAALLENIDKQGEGGPGAETGPILNAVGTVRFFNLLREAALATGYQDEPVPITDFITLTMLHLDDPTRRPRFVEASTQLQLFAPRGLHTPLTTSNPLPFSGDFFCLPQRPDLPLTGHWDSYLPYDSVRAGIVNKLIAHLPRPAAYDLGAQSATGSRQSWWPSGGRRPFRVIQPIRSCFDEPALPGVTVWKNQGMREPVAALAFDETPAPDAFVFPPFNLANPRAMQDACYALHCALVAKDLEARRTDVPLLVMILGGCWTPIIDLVRERVVQGMAKDFIMTRSYEHRPPILPGIDWSASAHLDVLTADSYAALRQAAVQVLDYRRQAYRRFTSQAVLNYRFSAHGDAPAAGNFTAALCTSAMNDNAQLLRANFALGKGIAARGHALVTGGGDRHAMGAGAFGYLAGGGAQLSGISTPNIVVSETRHGRRPEEFHYWESHPDIYRRMAAIFARADVVYLLPGGFGTNQESLAARRLESRSPAAMAGKTIVYADIDLGSGGSFWRSYLELTHGLHATAELMSQGADRQQGRYRYARTVDGLLQIHDELATRPAQPAPTGMRQPAVLGAVRRLG